MQVNEVAFRWAKRRQAVSTFLTRHASVQDVSFVPVGKVLCDAAGLPLPFRCGPVRVSNTAMRYANAGRYTIR